MFKISLILPVYNSEEVLPTTLNCLLSQTFTDYEMICVDDGSTDDSLKVLKEYEKKDSRIRVISQANGGAGKARNTGLDAAKGEYLAFLDADDLYDPDMLSKAYSKAVEGDADLVVWKCDRYNDTTKEYTPTPWTLREKDLPPYRPMYHRNFTDNVFKVFVGWAWDKLFRRDFVLENGLRFQEIRTSNDMLFTFMGIVLAKRIEIVPEVLAHHRVNDMSSLSNTREKSWDCFYQALCALRDSLKKHNLYNELEQDYINYALHFSLWHLDTIKGEKREVLYNTLKNQWFKDLGIEGKERGYFYIKHEYDKYSQIKAENIGKYFADESSRF